MSMLNFICSNSLIILVLVLEVLGLSFLETYHPNSFDNIIHTAAKGHLNFR